MAIETVGDLLRTGAIVAGSAGGLFLAYHGARFVIDDVHARRVQWREDRLAFEAGQLELERSRQQAQLANLRQIAPDRAGRLGVVYDGQNFRDLDNMRAYTLDAVRETWPAIERLDAIAKVVLAGGGWPGGQAQDALLEAGSREASPSWAESYPLRELLNGETPSIHNLVIGARPAENAPDVVTRSLNELMHVLTVGASGWGKSTWLRSFLYQVARAREPVEVCAIDTSGSALNALRGWGKLRYPVARSVTDACAVLDQVGQEIERRRGLYERYPHAENLREYNAASGQNMPPWVVVADESTHLLHKAGVGEPLREVVTTARQYGLYLLLAGQTAKASVIDTEIRDQFSSRLCFHTSPPSSRVVIDDRGAADLHEKGRAKVQLVGTELIELQGPWVSKKDFMGALTNGGPRCAMPVTLAPATETKADRKTWTEEQSREVHRRHADGESDTAIARHVFKHGTSYYIDRVRSILANNNNNKTGNAERENDQVGARDRGGYVVVADVCEFCGQEVQPGQTCAACGVYCCASCADDRGHCPDCQKGV